MFWSPDQQPILEHLHTREILDGVIAILKPDHISHLSAIIGGHPVPANLAGPREIRGHPQCQPPHSNDQTAPPVISLAEGKRQTNRAPAMVNDERKPGVAHGRHLPRAANRQAAEVAGLRVTVGQRHYPAAKRHKERKSSNDPGWPGVKHSGASRGNGSSVRRDCTGEVTGR